MRGLYEKKGRYYGTFYDKHRSPKRKYIPLGTTSYKRAEISFAKLRDEYDKGLYDPWEDRVDRNLTFEQVADKYLAAHSRQSPNTRKQKEWLYGSVGKRMSKPFDSLTATDIKRVVETKDRNERSRSSVAASLSALWSWAVDEGYASENVVSEYMRKRLRGMSRHQKEEAQGKRSTILMPSDMRRMMDRVYEYTSKCHANSEVEWTPDVFEFAIATGLRRNEIVHLNRRDVEIRGHCGLLRVRSWTNPTTKESFRTKTAKDRLVPLCPRAAMIANRWVEKYPTDEPYAPVFHMNGERFKPAYLSQTFKSFRPNDRVVLHSLRHSFISWLLILRCDPLAVRDIAGHESLAVQNRYSHTIEETITGRASEIQREIISYLCPGAIDIERFFPKSSAWRQHLNVSRPTIPSEDLLFSGIIYEEEYEPQD